MNAPAAPRQARAKYAEIGIQLPRGRYVLGSLTKLQTKDMRQQPLEERRHHWFNAFAIEKHTPGVADAINALFGHAWNSYSAVAGAQAVLQQIGLGFGATAFAWGVTDADRDPKWAAREGCKGCYIFKTRRNIAIGPTPCFDPNIVTLDPNAIGLGDYVDVFLVAAINGEVGGTAGMFLQPGGVRWLETGQRIVPAGRSGAEMFGQPLGYGHTGAAPGPMNAQMMGQMGNAAPTVGMHGGHGTPGMMGNPAGGHAAVPHSAPGMAGPAPGSVYQHYAVNPLTGAPTPPPPAAAPAPPPPVEPAEVVAARHQVPHHPGFRFNPAIWNYEVDVVPTQPPAHAHAHQPGITSPQMSTATYSGSAAPVGTAGQYSPNGVPAPAAPAPAPQYQAAPLAVPGGQQATAYPGNPYGPGNPPAGVQPHTGFAGGPPRIG